MIMLVIVHASPLAQAVSVGSSGSLQVCLSQAHLEGLKGPDQSGIKTTNHDTKIKMCGNKIKQQTTAIVDFFPSRNTKAIEEKFIPE